MYKKDSGITIIALIITVIVMLIIVSVSIKFGTEAVDKARLEDIKTDMISVKTKAKTIEEKYIFGDIEDLVGKTLDEDVNTQGIQTTRNLPSNLKNELELKNGNLYIWDGEILSEQSLSNIKTDSNNFYIVYYDTENSTCEVYYSSGYTYKGTTYYSLTDMQEI